mmetsp:Transcript_23620/g.35496  ORF Transcript_23620/g.35496 Transcript_23620/m.35496 type:complete len:100 (+) Transcript_23620:652-951(+)
MQSWVNFGFTWFSYSGVCCSNRFRFGCFPCGKLVIHRLCATLAQKLPLFILRPLVASGLFLGGTYGGKGVYTTWQQRLGFFPCLSVQHFYFFSITIFYT